MKFMAHILIKTVILKLLPVMMIMTIMYDQATKIAWWRWRFCLCGLNTVFAWTLCLDANCLAFTKPHGLVVMNQWCCCAHVSRVYDRPFDKSFKTSHYVKTDLHLQWLAFHYSRWAVCSMATCKDTRLNLCTQDSNCKETRHTNISVYALGNTCTESYPVLQVVNFFGH